MKTIWIASSQGTYDGVSSAYFTREEAVDTAEYWWAHLTDKERRTTTVSVESWLADVDEDDLRDAETLYRDMIEDHGPLDSWDPITWEEIDGIGA